MALEFAEIFDNVLALMQDNAQFISSGQIELAIKNALRQIDKDIPRTLVFDINGDGTQDYKLPVTFVRSVSLLKDVETPAGQNPPILRRRDDDWFVYEDPSKPAGEQLRLRFRLSAPSATEVIRIRFTSPHIVDQDTSTLDQTSFQAVIYKTLVYAFRSLAAFFTQSTNPAIAIDAVDYAGRAQAFLFLAERYDKSYKQILGIGEKVSAAFATHEADIVFSHGEDMIFHPKLER